MRHQQGYSIIHLVIAIAIFVLVTTLILLAANPRYRLARAYDDIREAGVRDIMQALIELDLHEHDRFESVLAVVENDRHMIGVGSSCEGYFGSQCGDAQIADTCLDLAQDIVPTYLAGMPFDAKPPYSELRTGYYLEYEQGLLTVGACQPESQEEIILTNRIRWD